MKTLYDWLLYNTGNAGNYYTILNTKRDDSDSLEVMARLSDFKIVTLVIGESKNASMSDESFEAKYVFADEQQVITYLAEGKTPEAQPSDERIGIQVFITEPGGEAGDITFPHAQA